MRYELGTSDPSASVPVPVVSPPTSPTFSLPAAPPPPSVPIGTSAGSRDPTANSAHPYRSTSPEAAAERPVPSARSTFPSPPSHPNPAFASVLKREAAAADRTAQAASVAGPSTQPETAVAASAALSGGGSGPIRLTGAAGEEAQFSEGEYDEGEGPHTLIERFKDTMAENSAVVSTFIAGGLAGAASRTVVSPLERLKIIL